MTEGPKTRRKTEKVWFADKEVLVKELTLGQFEELANIVEKVESLAEVFGKIEDMEPLQIVKAVAGLMKQAPQTLGEILSLATDMDPNQVKEGTATELLELITAIVRVNNFVDAFKKKVDILFPSLQISPESPEEAPASD